MNGLLPFFQLQAEYPAIRVPAPQPLSPKADSWVSSAHNVPPPPPRSKVPLFRFRFHARGTPTMKSYRCALGYEAVCWRTGRGRGARRPYGGVEAGTAAAQTNY
ncbi:hypothetical protein CXB51_011183 [Gossypium anomalum]|uniref:Uncharacterized protein n=1 Tax=Gossypium anomalum TaxID=47600 RepID=A0A8J5ZP45_9ROSI|nr:hypothetical protein CXB51_011183 [Gossypium anomalum]